MRPTPEGDRLTFNERDFAGAGRLGVMVERPGPAWRSWRKG